MNRTLIVVDDFLSDPDTLRALALKQQYARQGSAGVRSHYRLPADHEVARKLQSILGKTIDWDAHPMNGRFQYCTAKDPIIYHSDHQRWAGVVYLTPYAPLRSGVRLLRSLWNGRRTAPKEAAERVRMYGQHYDGNIWETVDEVGNIYNRLVLWNGLHAHAATSYFGYVPQDARLFLTLFID